MAGESKQLLIGITGASGQLGQMLMKYYPDALPIGRTMSSQHCDILIHTAAPHWQDELSVDNFRHFNDEVVAYIKTHQPIVINLGSWWQLAEGSCRELSYVKLKNEQEQMLQDARHLYPYQIFGEVKGFIYDILNGRKIDIVDDKPLDFVHVSDVARAVKACLDELPGRYAVFSEVLTYPKELVPNAKVEIRQPVAITTYPLPSIVEPKVNLKNYMRYSQELGI